MEQKKNKPANQHVANSKELYTMEKTVSSLAGHMMELHKGGNSLAI